ncbi:class I SAM-dependent methyltransferase [Microtetraspora sp. NBRC 13810]|uniref:class I SAM-dependent methyltransferase n=1 Tax=Microtetraspora sp. NBRC 13810 TaxID=3030990 RepID=UPI002556B13F|nr:class I SAM-dependent methyltransferase [Microtetraspora sp. NBRC 13810]
MSDFGMHRDISPDTFQSHASSFGQEAALYAESRPDYPDAAVLWALEPVAGRSPLRVLDLGAGTGKLTEALLRHAGEVVAVEPDPAMLGELRRWLPEVRALGGSAEEIPLPDGSVDAILVGQAMHWFDLDRAAPEMARVLTPGGVLAGLWNTHDDRVPWVAELSRVSDRSIRTFRDWSPEGFDLAMPRFPAIEHAAFPHAHRRTAESLVATIATHSQVLLLPEADRSALDGRITSYLRSLPETAEGEFDVPLVTAVIRGVVAS